MQRTITVAATLCLALVLVPAPAAAATPRPLYRIVIDGPISPAVADYIGSAVKEAHAAGAPALIIQLDTPGGLLNSTKTIVKEIMSAPLPVIVYVGPGGAGAISAGVFITLSAHIAAMAPGTTIGAAHPVGAQGQDIKGDMRDKVENYTVSFVESIAARRGRNVEWAEQAVRESVAITESEALEKGVIDIVAVDLDGLVEACNGREVEIGGHVVVLDLSAAVTSEGRVLVVDLEQTLRQRVLSVITDPNIAYLLMMAGMLGLYMEFSNPGVIFPGVAGAICLLLALLASQVLPISSTGVLLLLLGMAFLLGELLLPSFGVLGFGGILALTLGSLFLYTPESGLSVDLSYITVTVLLFAAGVGAILILLVGDRRRGSVTASEGLVGEQGVAVTRVGKSGKVKVHGEFWNATSDSTVEKGQSIKVKSVTGLTLKVGADEE